MPVFKDDRVKLCGGTVLWDGINKPEKNESGNKWLLKVAFPPNHPDMALLEQLATRKLGESVFKGVLPRGGTMPIAEMTAQEANGQFTGWKVFNCGSYRGVPDIYDENNIPMDIAQAGHLIFTGQKVDVLVHCYVNNGTVKGVACGLDAFSIIASANAQRIQIGAASYDSSQAFGGAPSQAGANVSAPPQQHATPIEMLGGADYQAHVNAGWNDDQLISAGKARAWPAPAGVDAPPGQGGVDAPPGNNIAPPPQQHATPIEMLGGADYQAHISAGWNDDQLISAGKARAWPAPSQSTSYLPQ